MIYMWCTLLVCVNMCIFPTLQSGSSLLPDMETAVLPRSMTVSSADFMRERQAKKMATQKHSSSPTHSSPVGDSQPTLTELLQEEGLYTCKSRWFIFHNNPKTTPIALRYSQPTVLCRTVTVVHFSTARLVSLKCL